MRRILILVALSVALLASAGAAQAKKPVQNAAPATLTATWSGGQLSVAGCGYDVLIAGGVQVVYTHPDATSETWGIGVWNDGPATSTHPDATCLDTNYIFASQPGTWTVTTFQSGTPLASTTVIVG